MSGLSFILAGMLAAATPFLLAALGELVAERSGVLNLGIEGMMALGAVVAFITGRHGGGHALGFLAGGLAAAALSLVFAWLALGLRANQVAAGLAIGIMGQGLSALFGKGYESLSVTGLPRIALPGLSDLPVAGGLFAQDAVVWLSLVGTLAIWAVLRFSRAGLVIRAVGENPRAARAIGYPVLAIRAGAILFGGLMAGLAGAYAATVYTPLWANGMIAGRGWIALALVVFASWLPFRLMVGAYLFGGITILQLHAQAMGLGIPSQLMSSLPYLATIIVLVAISWLRGGAGSPAPASLGLAFVPDR